MIEILSGHTAEEGLCVLQGMIPFMPSPPRSPQGHSHRPILGQTLSSEGLSQHIRSVP